MNISLKDFEFRKALSWKSCHKMKSSGNLAITLKIRFFKITIEKLYYMKAKPGLSTIRWKK